MHKACQFNKFCNWYDLCPISLISTHLFYDKFSVRAFHSFRTNPVLSHWKLWKELVLWSFKLCIV